MEVLIRDMQPQDAADVAALSGQFGYPVDGAAMAARIARLPEHPQERAWVADHGGRVIGWMQAAHTLRLESGEAVEIVALVVDMRARGGGVGRSLVQAAQEWMQALGLSRMVVRMNVTRTETRGFYARLGFVEKKQQVVWERR